MVVYPSKKIIYLLILNERKFYRVYFKKCHFRYINQYNITNGAYAYEDLYQNCYINESSDEEEEDSFNFNQVEELE